MAPQANSSGQTAYTAVPTNAISPDPNNSPDPTTSALDRLERNSRYSALGAANPPDSAYLAPSPELADAALLGRPGSEYLPAPSIMTRDSTFGSLPGTPPLGGDNRRSWGSGVGLAAGAAGIAGRSESPSGLGLDGRRPSAGARAQSGLAHSSLGWNNTTDERLSTSDEDEEQGHITPAVAGVGAGEALNEKTPKWASGGFATKSKSRKGLWIGLGVGAVAIIALAAGLGAGLTRKSKSTSSGSAANSSANGGTNSVSGSGTSHGTATSAAPSATATSGQAGSLITMADGTQFTYENSFGGTWVWDEANPFNNDAQAQSYTPALSSNWTWGVDKVYGVNVGGWLNTEPFIVPALYEKYATGPNNVTAVDEYTLSQNMGNNLTAALTEHYETFITEKDFAEIAGAGLNWVRIPIPYWAIETWDGEPYLERVAWTYFLKAIQWSRKYGLRINLDLHNAPGSENGWNHSGRQGSINWMSGVMGLANAQRSLDYVRTLAQFIAQPEYAPVIQMFGFINEPNAGSIGRVPVGSYYYEAYNIIRDITGIGAGNGPYLSIHDGFLGANVWYGFLPGADRLGFDQHTYLVFQDQAQGTIDTLKKLPCQYWASSTNTTSQTWGTNVAGEWSAAWNDCGLWVNNVGAGSRYDGSYSGYENKALGSCDEWNDYRQWNDSTIAALNHFVSGTMDAMQNYFFWTWKIGNSTGTLTEVNPFWHYRLGLANGWIPKDPRSAAGTCEGDGVTSNPFDGTYSSAWMTGGAGAGTIDASMSSSYPWPPVSFTNVGSASMDQIYQYTQTGTPITMPGPTYTSPGSSATISAGNGWFNANADSRQAYAAVSGCSYAPEYSAAGLSIPDSACGAGLTQPTKRAAIPEPAPVPGPTQAPKARR